MASLPTVLSFGGGVNSVALLLRLVRDGRAPDVVIFADTGEEHQRTYDYIERYVRPFCAEHAIRFEVVRNSDYDSLIERVLVHVQRAGRLFDYYLARRAVPSLRFRDCTYKFKVTPVRRWVKEHLGASRKHPVTMIMGIASEEATRVKDSNRLFVVNQFPLVFDYNMDRSACEAEIAAYGWPSPGKSGCIGCLYSSLREMWELSRKEPDRFARLKHVEATARARNPRFTLLPKGPPLDVIECMREADVGVDTRTGECLAGDVCGIAVDERFDVHEQGAQK